MAHQVAERDGWVKRVQIWNVLANTSSSRDRTPLWASIAMTKAVNCLEAFATYGHGCQRELGAILEVSNAVALQVYDAGTDQDCGNRTRGVRLVPLSKDGAHYSYD